MKPRYFIKDKTLTLIWIIRDYIDVGRRRKAPLFFNGYTIPSSLKSQDFTTSHTGSRHSLVRTDKERK